MRKSIFNMFKGVMSFLMMLLLVFTLVACDEEIEEGPDTYQGTRETDALKLTSKYEGLSFLNDGIGEVKLNQTVDGDTAHFEDKKTGEWFTARFLCVNTPESTGRVDPWGKAASKFVGDILKQADVIVCESKVNGDKAELDSTLKRYLAFVWYKIGDQDFRLLNLELVENALSRFTDDYSQVKYGEQFHIADMNMYNLKYKVYGENDPDYDYTGSKKEITIAELRSNFDEYSGGTTLIMTARVMRFSGNNMYVQDLYETENEETGEFTRAGIYVFSGYATSLASKIKIGQVIKFECQCTDNENYGRQLTNPNKVKLVSDAPEEYSLIELTSDDLPQGGITLGQYEGFVVQMDKLKVKSTSNPNEEGAFTIYCETEDGQEVNVRIDGAVNPKLVCSSVVIGATYRVTGGVSKYKESYQIMLGNQTEGLEDFVLVQ